jgi:nicotinate-nucleotide adenylyltransferase
MIPRIGVFGGTFDPIHVGHLIAAEILRYSLRLEQVIFLPAGRPPHKPTQVLAEDIDRVAMLKLALDGRPDFAISKVDLDRPGYSYTARSLEILRAELPDAVELYFLMGQDSLRDFPNWRYPDQIACQARLGVAQRPGFDVSVTNIEAAVPETVGRIELVPIPLIGISSRDLRRRICSGEPFRYQVLPTVADYIECHGLYRAADETQPV